LDVMQGEKRQVPISLAQPTPAQRGEDAQLLLSLLRTDSGSRMIAATHSLLFSWPGANFKLW
jgi:hypothetical protein